MPPFKGKMSTTCIVPQCKYKCEKNYDMCGRHADYHRGCVISIFYFGNVPESYRRTMEIPTNYEEAEKFERAVGRTRLLIEARRNMEARLLEIGKKVAARRIMNTWRWVNANPNYCTCRTRLEREFLEMKSTYMTRVPS